MKNKGKQIDYEALLAAENKVNLGCKCSPNLKLELAREAVNFGMSLSEYVELLVSNRNVDHKVEGEVQSLKEQLAFYENGRLRTVFVKNKGSHTTYTDFKGEERQIIINTIQDAFTVIINSIE